MYLPSDFRDTLDFANYKVLAIGGKATTLTTTLAPSPTVEQSWD